MLKPKLQKYATSMLIIVYLLVCFPLPAAFSAPPYPLPPPPGPRHEVRHPAPRPPAPAPPRRVNAPRPRFHGSPFGVPVPRGVVHRRLPPDVMSLHVAGALFFYHLGAFYKQTKEGYVSVEAPVGARVRVLPNNCATLRVGGNLYFNCSEVYYEPIDNGYLVVDPPIATHNRNPQAIPGDRVSIQAGTLNVRSGPGVRFKIVGKLYRGQIVKVDSVDRGWYYVMLSDGSYGWVMSRYTKLKRRRHNGGYGPKG